MILVLLVAALVAWLSGCAPMSSKPEHAPLPASVQRIPDGEIYAKCAKAWPLWQHVVMFPILPLGCAERFPQHNVCIIWLGETSTDGVEEHERAHCAGYSH